VPSIAATLIYCLPYGGPVSMIWGWLMSSCLILTIGVAMSELASSMPTSGGLYFWTHRLSSPKVSSQSTMRNRLLTTRQYRDFLAWMVGCAL
jgi:amino acid transporter